MSAIEGSFVDNVKSFIKNHKVLCVTTLGLAVIGYSIGKLAGRAVIWIRESRGTTQKASIAAREAINTDVYAQARSLSGSLNPPLPAEKGVFLDESKKLKQQSATLENAIMQDYNSIIDYLSSHVMDNLDQQLDQYEKDHPELDRQEQLTIDLLRNALQAHPNIVDRFRSNSLRTKDIILLQTAKPFYSAQDANFFDHLETLYTAQTTDKAVSALIRECKIPIESHDLIRTSLKRLSENRDQLRQVRQSKLNIFIANQKPAWLRSAKTNHHGMTLINRHTEEGKRLIEDIGRSLAEEFDIHSILVDKSGKVFVRYDSDVPFARGAYKEVFKVKEKASNDTYVWAVVKGKEQLAFYDKEAIKEFRNLLERTSHEAFNRVNEFVRYGTTGISIDELYDGDAAIIRQKQGNFVLKGSAILKLANGLTFLHNHGFAHRDIKGENILLKNDDAVWHDYDFLSKTDAQNLRADGTHGYIPPEHMFRGMLGTPIAGSSLPKADVFAFATTLLEDLDPRFEKSGYSSARHQEYLEEIRQLDLPLEQEKKSLIKDSSPEDTSYFLRTRCTVDEQNYVLKTWITLQQQKHEAKAPIEGDGKPYFTYRKLLWEALSPNPEYRPDSATFENRLQQLNDANELPN